MPMRRVIPRPRIGVVVHASVVGGTDPDERRWGSDCDRWRLGSHHTASDCEGREQQAQESESMSHPPREFRGQVLSHSGSPCFSGYFWIGASFPTVKSLLPPAPLVSPGFREMGSGSGVGGPSDDLDSSLRRSRKRPTSP